MMFVPKTDFGPVEAASRQALPTNPAKIKYGFRLYPLIGSISLMKPTVVYVRLSSCNAQMDMTENEPYRNFGIHGMFRTPKNAAV